MKPHIFGQYISIFAFHLIVSPEETKAARVGLANHNIEYAVISYMTPSYWPVFQDNLGKLVPERQTILDYVPARDDGGGGGATTTLRHAQHQLTNNQFLQVRCPSYCPNNNVKALNAKATVLIHYTNSNCWSNCSKTSETDGQKQQWSNYFAVEGDESSSACRVILGQLFQLMIDCSLQRLQASNVRHVVVLSRQPLALSRCVQRLVPIGMTATQPHPSIHLKHQIYFILTAIFPGGPRLANCPLILVSIYS